MNKLFFLILVLLFSRESSNAQKILTIDLTEVNSTIKNNTSPFFYDSLIERYAAFDTTLSKQDFHYLYYGSYFQSTYFPYSSNESLKQFYYLLRSKEFGEALIHGKMVVNSEPLNLKALFGMYVCYSKLGQPNKAEVYLYQYYGLLSAIFNSGDGNSIETAYVVLSVDDEYEVISSMHHHVKKQQLVDGPTDLMFVVKNKSNPKKTPTYKRLYFNVELPFLYMRNN